MSGTTTKGFWVVGMGLVCWSVMGMGVSSPAFGYDEIAVTNGGVLTGKVTLDGPVPEPRIFPVALSPFGPFCGRNAAISDGHGNVRISEFAVSPTTG